MSRLTRLNKPWLHFIVLGVVLYLLESTVFPQPKPTVGPLSEARIETLKEQWRISTGREPTEAQLAGFIAAELVSIPEALARHEGTVRSDEPT